MNERLKFEGHLAVLKQDAKKLEIQLNGLVEALRNNLDPLCPVHELDAERIASQGIEFAVKHAEYTGILSEIAKAKKILGQ
jgi:hypothetical protein